MAKAKTGITRADLESAVEAAGGIDALIDGRMMADDYASVDFDFENLTADPDKPFDMPGFEPGYGELPGGVPVLWCAAGGDWELPVAFCVYLGEDGRPHAYVPRGGNSFNKDANAAYGNASLPPDEEAGRDGGYEFDMDAMRAETAAAVS